MKRLLVLAALAPVMALASSAFDGTWKTDLHTFKATGKPDIYELSGGMYACNSCAPAYKIKADGTDQPVPDTGFSDHGLDFLSDIRPSMVKQGQCLAFCRQVHGRHHVQESR